MRKIALFLFSLLIAITAYAGPADYQGIVVDEFGEPLIGVSVKAEDSGTAVTTDIDGNFTIKAQPGDILRISYVGYRETTIKIASERTLRIALEPNVETFDEIVVVGYGEMKKADLTGAVTNITGGKLESLHSTSVAQSLQGAMPGVYVSRSSGMPGATASIQIRGVTTIGDSSPLVIVDGVPESLESINPTDIESVNVLKDAASASIYGARAAAGVILVTTKKAREGKARVEYQGSVGFIQATETPRAVGWRDYMAMCNELSWNDGGNIPGNEHSVYPKELMESYAQNHAENPDLYPITDWRSVLMRKTAPTTKHDLKVSYGNKVIQSKISLGYEETEALYHGRSYQKLMARVNSNYKVNDWLSFSFDGYYRRGINKQPNVNPLASILYMTPVDAATLSNGEFASGHEGNNPYAALMDGGKSRRTTDRFGAKISVILNPLKDLTITAAWAPGMLLTNARSYTKKVGYFSPDDPDHRAGFVKGYEKNDLTETRDTDTWGTKQLFVNYNHKFGKEHRTEFTAGYEDYTYSANTLTAASDDMALSDYFYLVNANSNELSVDGTAYGNAYRSLFGRANYTYKDRYMVQANARWDWSSRFDRKYRLGFFPSVSLGWRVTSEQWMNGISPAALSFLKLRASYGTLGNERIGNYPYQANITFAHPVFVDSTGKPVSVTAASQRDYNIPDITWETTRNWNVGFDANFLNSRLSVVFDWYWKKNEDMLLSIQLPVFMGYDNPKQNAGDMHTKGWDLQIGWHDSVNDFAYSVNFNLSDYRSVMGNMSGRVMDSDGKITRQGDEYQAWYGFRSNGFFSDWEDVALTPVLNGNVAPGDIKYIDVNGSEGLPDGMISSQYDRVVLGSSQPRLIYGAQLDFSWRGIELSATFNGIGKQNRMMTRPMLYQRHAAGWWQFTGEVVGTSWSPYNTPEQNLAARYPRLSDNAVDGSGNNVQTSDFWMFNGGYFRCKNISLAYSFRQSVLKRLQLDGLRVFASVSDPFCIDNYPRGWDPETADNGSSYIARTWNFGLQIRF